MAVFTVNSLSIGFSGGRMSRVDAYFSARDDDRRNNLNGNVELTVEEYLQNMSDELLVPLIKSKVVEFINGGLEEEPEGQAEPMMASTSSVQTNQINQDSEAVPKNEVKNNRRK